MKNSKFVFLTALLFAPLFLIACAEKPKTTVVKPPTRAYDPAAEQIPKEEAYDPCAMQMQDICGAILLYYTLNHQLPPKLQDVAPFADELTTLHFECPVDKKPYVYVPRGLHSTQLEKTLILYDAEPVHDGHRWGIVMGRPQPGKPLLLFVIPLKNEVFKLYANGQ